MFPWTEKTSGSGKRGRMARKGRPITQGSATPPNPESVDALKQATREAHEALKDLNAIHAALKAERLRLEKALLAADSMIVDLLPGAVRMEFNRVLKAEVEASEVRLAKNLSETILRCDAAIRAKFDEVAEQFFSKGRRLHPTLEEAMAARKVAEWADNLVSSGVLISEVLEFDLPSAIHIKKEGNDDDQQPPSAFHRR